MEEAFHSIQPELIKDLTQLNVVLNGKGQERKIKTI
jgi:hypothetical protein